MGVLFVCCCLFCEDSGGRDAPSSTRPPGCVHRPQPRPLPVNEQNAHFQEAGVFHACAISCDREGTRPEAQSGSTTICDWLPKLLRPEFPHSPASSPSLSSRSRRRQDSSRFSFQNYVVR